MSAAPVTYPCDDCGYDGPHTLAEVQHDGSTYECGSCYVEFFVPDAKLP